MPDSQLTKILGTLADHERRLVALEEVGESGETPEPPEEERPPLRPEEPDRPEGDVAFEWIWGGKASEFNLILEPQGGDTGTVNQQSGFVRAHANPPRSGTTVKACGEKKHAYQPREGQIIEVTLDIELHDCRSAAELFLIDCETSDRSSSGTRLKINEDFCWRIDGGKLGFDSQNDMLSRDGAQYQIPRGRRFKATISFLISSDDDAWVTVDHDGVEVFRVEDVPTIPRDGVANKFQCLITALGDPQADSITLDTYGVTYRVLNA